MKITVYTITDCQFSKTEREYLKGHNLPFEEKNLETNREFLTEMLTVSNNFAGTPVTKIDKDDGQIVVLKGFTKEDFDKALGFEAPAAQKTEEKKPEAPKTETTQPASPPQEQTAAPAPAPAAPETPSPVAQPPVETVPPQTAAPANDPMASILNNLAQQAVGTDSSAQPAAPSAPPSAAPPSGMPVIPDPQL